MLKIRIMPNAEKFLSLVDQSCGDMFLHMPDGSFCSLKQNQIVRQMLRITRPGQDGISITFSNSEDVPTFLRYLVETAR